MTPSCAQLTRSMRHADISLADAVAPPPSYARRRSMTFGRGRSDATPLYLWLKTARH